MGAAVAVPISLVGEVCFLYVFTYLSMWLSELAPLLADATGSELIKDLFPTTVNHARVGASQAEFAAAVLNNAMYASAFAVHHSVAARSWFKSILTRVVPHYLERTCYVLTSNALVYLVLTNWQPLPLQVFWDVRGTTLGNGLILLHLTGCLIAVAASFTIDHFDLLGVRQALAGSSYQPSKAFIIRFMYRIVRHPLQLGIMICLWATPYMTASHLLAGVLFQAYILVGLSFEERDLVRMFGKRYLDYRKTTNMLIPNGSVCPYLYVREGMSEQYNKKTN